MNAAGLTSPRLQRVLRLLSDGRPHTTRDVVRKERVMAVSACVAELLFHGAKIICLRQHVDGKPRFFYTMTKGPDLK